MTSVRTADSAPPGAQGPFRLLGPARLPLLSPAQLAVRIRARRARLASLASEWGIAASPDDVARGTEMLRAQHGLVAGAEKETFLRRTGIDERDLEALLEGEWLHTTVRRALSRAAAVQRIFSTHRALFETIEAAGLPFEERAAAETLLGELRAGRARFPIPVPPNPQTLAAPSLAGYLGLVTRADVPAEVAEVLFADDVEQFVGPVAYDRRYWVFQILLARSAELNEAIYEYCEDLLVEEALAAGPSELSPRAAGCRESRSGGT